MFCVSLPALSEPCPTFDSPRSDFFRFACQLSLQHDNDDCSNDCDQQRTSASHHLWRSSPPRLWRHARQRDACREAALRTNLWRLFGESWWRHEHATGVSAARAEADTRLKISIAPVVWARGDHAETGTEFVKKKIRHHGFVDKTSRGSTRQNRENKMFTLLLLSNIHNFRSFNAQVVIHTHPQRIRPQARIKVDGLKGGERAVKESSRAPGMRHANFWIYSNYNKYLTTTTTIIIKTIPYQS